VPADPNDPRANDQHAGDPRAGEQRARMLERRALFAAERPYVEAPRR